MKKNTPPPFESLERIFHEPSRMAILSALCAADTPLSFTQIRAACGLTDGNLNRHLKTLEESGVVRVDKSFVDAKPRTTIRITRAGLDRFNDYLVTLSDALKSARSAAPARARPGWSALPRRAEA